MRAIRCLLAAGLAAGIVAVVTAQPGGFGGRGGFVDVNTAVVDNPALHEELKVTDAQKEKFKPLAEKRAALNKKFGEMFGKGKGGKGFDKDAFAELGKERETLNEEIKKAVDQTLTAEQKKRLKQINIQVAGLGVFGDPEAKSKFGGGPSEAQKATMKEVQDALKLSDKQKTAIREIATEFNKDSGEIRREVGFGKKADPEKRAEADKKIAKLRKESYARVEEALDDTQKRTWKELVGEAFDTSKLNPPPTRKD